MVKRCSWGSCNSDTRYPDRVMHVTFIPFPKPKTNYDKCLRWVKACGRPQHKLNTTKISRHRYVCSKHFDGGNGPTPEFPDPVPADESEVQKIQQQWRQRQAHKTNSMKVDLEALKTKITDEFGILSNSNYSPSTPSDQKTASPTGETSSHKDLTAAEELEILQQQNKLQKEQIHQQTILIKYLTQCKEYGIPSGAEDISPVTVESILKQEENIKGLFEYYTGLEHSNFLLLYQFLTKNNVPMFAKNTEIESMTSDQQLLLTLMRLRHNFDVKDLASRFCISTTTVSVTFVIWVDHMYLLLGAIPIWPHRDDIIKDMSQELTEESASTLVYIGCTELKIQKPSSSIKVQSHMDSNHKSSATSLKGLVACDPMGIIIFVSELQTGSISDKEIAEKSGFLNLLKQIVESGFLKHGDSVMADEAFTISDDLEKIGIGIQSSRDQPQACQADETLDEKTIQRPTHTKLSIRRIRKFKMISHCVPTNNLALVNKIWIVCSLLTLWQNK